MSCKVALQRMEAHGVIWLPLPTREKPGPRRGFSEASAPAAPITGTLADLGPVRVDPVGHHAARRPGALPGLCRRSPAAALGFGAAAWSVAPRDRYIGWTRAEREAHLPLVADLHRFLVLPGVSVPCLASHLLGRVLRRLPGDWVGRHGLRPVLLETFVEADHFRGTCYRAANWIHVGQTQGRGRMDRTHRRAETIKDVYLFPLDPGFRTVLIGGRIRP